MTGINQQIAIFGRKANSALAGFYVDPLSRTNKDLKILVFQVG